MIKIHKKNNTTYWRSWQKKSFLFAVFYLEQPIHYKKRYDFLLYANLIQHFWYIIFIQLAEIAGIEKIFKNRIWGFNIRI
jgi:hypothetical protein